VTDYRSPLSPEQQLLAVRALRLDILETLKREREERRRERKSADAATAPSSVREKARRYFEKLRGEKKLTGLITTIWGMIYLYWMLLGGFIGYQLGHDAGREQIARQYHREAEEKEHQRLRRMGFEP
jgi:hypothetical protein